MLKRLSVQVLALSVSLISVGPASAEVIDFDDLADPSPAFGATISNGYRSLDWTNSFYIDGTSSSSVVMGTGWDTGLVSSPQIFTNTSPGVASVVTIPSGTFDLNGMYITSVCNTGMTVTVAATGPINSFSQNVVVGVSGSTWFDFNYDAIDTLTITPAGGTDAGVCTAAGNEQFAIDDLTINELIIDPNDPNDPNNPSASEPDDYLLYKAKNDTKAGPKFEKFGPLTLTDAVMPSGANYDVIKAGALGVPAENGTPIIDPNTDMREYKLKASFGTPKFNKLADVVANTEPCGDAAVTLVKPVSLLVPTNMDASSPTTAPDPNNSDIDHYTCYKAVGQKKFKSSGSPAPFLPKKTQMDVMDELQDRRYDIKKISKLCLATDKAGSPLIIGGPNAGTPKPITPATRKNTEAALLCYKAKSAKLFITQVSGSCGEESTGGPPGPLNQDPHTKRDAVFTSNQFGDDRVDTVKESELCVPATVTLPAP